MVIQNEVNRSTTCVIFLFFVLTMFSTRPARAQITGNVNVRDPKAMTITPEIREMLCGKTWYCVDITEVRRGEVSSSPRRRNTLIFNRDGRLENSSEKFGEWKIVNNQFLQVTDVPKYRQSATLLNGAYSIYELTDSTLVLVQILTSTGDWKREFRFSINEQNAPVYRPMLHNVGNDQLRVGEKITYYPNGQIESIENYEFARSKASKEWVFDHGYPDDTTLFRLVATGKWTYFFPDGSVQSLQYHDDQGRSIGRWISYNSDGTVASATLYDSAGQSQYHDKYEYKRNTALPLIERYVRNRKRVFVIGKKDSIEFNEQRFHHTGIAGSVVNKIIRAYNLTGNEIRLRVSPNAELRINPADLLLTVDDLLEFPLQVTIPPGDYDGKIHITSSEWTLDIDIHTFGFHISTSDFESFKNRTLPGRFYLHKDSEEHELRIEAIGRRTKERLLPVSKQMTGIELKKGRYKLSLIGKSGVKGITVTVQN